MRVVKQLKDMNRFQDVNIPRNSEFFYRLQGRAITPSPSQFTGEESMPFQVSKTEALSRANKELTNEIRREAAEAAEAARKAAEEAKQQ